MAKVSGVMYRCEVCGCLEGDEDNSVYLFRNTRICDKCSTSDNIELGKRKRKRDGNIQNQSLDELFWSKK
jgi:hypothetical protein